MWDTGLVPALRAEPPDLTLVAEAQGLSSGPTSKQACFRFRHYLLMAPASSPYSTRAWHRGNAPRILLRSAGKSLRWPRPAPVSLLPLQPCLYNEEQNHQ